MAIVPAALASLVQLSPCILRLSTFPAMMLDGFMQPMIGF
jgi:hypothetical protein